MREQVDSVDRRIARIAATQHGVISSAQLSAAGVGGSAASRRAASGRLHRVHRGVYAVGHPGLSPHGRWLAAVLACGEGAVLSHGNAAQLWELIAPRAGDIHVSIPRATGCARREGVVLHRCVGVLGNVTRRRGIPVTTPARTLADLRRIGNDADLLRATRSAEALGLDLGPLTGDGTRSALEAAFLRLCRAHGIAAPEVNVPAREFVAGHRGKAPVVDFLWRRQRLVVETDGFRFHRGREAFEADRRRDLLLAGHGYEVLRLSHRQLTEEPAAVAATVARLLVGRSGAAGR